MERFGLGSPVLALDLVNAMMLLEGDGADERYLGLHLIVSFSTHSPNSTMNRHTILSGKNALHKFLQSEQANFLRKAPVLLVSSATPEHAASPHASIPQVDTACRKLKFFTGIEMGLLTVDSHVTSVFPTVENVASTLEIMQRTGASSVIGVGSGAAMDLTKAVLKERRNDENSHGVLVPSTYGALVASTSQLPLLLDTREEALIVPNDKTSKETQQEYKNEFTIITEMDTLADIHQKDVTCACLAIAVDAIYRSQTTNNSSSNELAMDLLDHALGATKEEFPLLFLDAGRRLDFGVGVTGSSARSSPLALAASLIPPSFPNVNILTFMASLLPGIVHTMGDGSFSYLDVDDAAPSLASFMVHADGAQSVTTLMSHVKSNRALWNCLDVSDDVLEEILHYSLDR